MLSSTKTVVGTLLLLGAILMGAIVGGALGPIVFLLGLTAGVVWLMDDKMKKLNDQLDEVIQLLKEAQDAKNP